MVIIIIVFASSEIDTIAVLLSSFGSEVEHTINTFVAQGVEYSTLSSLNRVDLELLGITNENTQNDMLKDFASLPAQDKHYEKYI